MRSIIHGNRINGDGYAEIIVGGGPGGGPRIYALSGLGLIQGRMDQVSNFFAGPTDIRSGVRPIVKDLDGDNQADLVVSFGEGEARQVIGYLGKTIQSDGAPSQAFSVNSLPSGIVRGIFVG